MAIRRARRAPHRPRNRHEIGTTHFVKTYPTTTKAITPPHSVWVGLLAYKLAMTLEDVGWKWLGADISCVRIRVDAAEHTLGLGPSVGEAYHAPAYSFPQILRGDIVALLEHLAWKHVVDKTDGNSFSHLYFAHLCRETSMRGCTRARRIRQQQLWNRPSQYVLKDFTDEH